MAQLIAKCRLTGHYMFMAVHVSAEDLARMPETFTRKFCPFCACEHIWHKSDAKLVDKPRVPKPTIQQAG